MSQYPGRSRQAQVAALARRARVAEAAGQVPEAISLLRELAQLDPQDRRTLHRLGDLFRLRLSRLREAATWYARAARAHEREGFPGHAIAEWRIVLVCDPVHVEAHEHIGGLYAETGHLADARQHYERSERVLREAGLGREATILRALRDALEDELPAAAPAPTPAKPAPAPADAPPAGEVDSPGQAEDADASSLAAERLSNGRVFRHFGLLPEARRQLEELLTVLPEHVEARQLLAEVCRETGDVEAAARHLDVLVHVMRSRGVAPLPAAEDPLGLPPVEEWEPEEASHDPFEEVFDAIREDVERLVDRVRDGKGTK